MIDREVISSALQSTGVKVRFASNGSGHYNVFAPSNLKPWTEEERAKLDSAIEAIKGEVYGIPHICITSQKCCRTQGRYIEAYNVERLKGFRVVPVREEVMPTFRLGDRIEDYCPGCRQVVCVC